MPYPNEKDDEAFLHKWREQRDAEEASWLKNAQAMSFLVKQELWIPGDPDNLKFLQEKSVSRIEWLSTIFRFRLHERRQVTVILGEGIVRVYIYRLPKNEEEARIIRYMLTLLKEERGKDKELITELLPRFERLFEFVDFFVDYNEEATLSDSEVYREIMAYLINKENQGNKTGEEENSL